MARPVTIQRDQMGNFSPWLRSAEQYYFQLRAWRRSLPIDGLQFGSTYRDPIEVWALRDQLLCGIGCLTCGAVSSCTERSPLKAFAVVSVASIKTWQRSMEIACQACVRKSSLHKNTYNLLYSKHRCGPMDSMIKQTKYRLPDQRAWKCETGR